MRLLGIRPRAIFAHGRGGWHVFLALCLLQSVAFPLTFFIWHMLGVMPSHPIALLNAVLVQVVWCNRMLGQAWERASARNSGAPHREWLRWDYVFHAIVGLMLFVYENLYERCEVPLTFSPPALRHLPAASWLVSAAYCHWAMDHLVLSQAVLEAEGRAVPKAALAAGPTCAAMK